MTYGLAPLAAISEALLGTAQTGEKDALADYKLWRIDSFHKSLHFKLVSEKNQAWSVRAGIGWRAVGIRTENVIIWFWIGSHADYDDLLINLRKSRISKTS